MNKQDKAADIWVVDDDEGILEVVALLFEQEQLNAQFFSDPQLMKKELNGGSKPKLLLLDVFMSGVNGVDIALSLKEKDQTKDIPIILLTANIDAEHKSKEAKAEGYLMKPFDIEELLAVVRGYLPTNEN